MCRWGRIVGERFDDVGRCETVDDPWICERCVLGKERRKIHHFAMSEGSRCTTFSLKKETVSSLTFMETYRDNVVVVG